MCYYSWTLFLLISFPNICFGNENTNFTSKIDLSKYYDYVNQKLYKPEESFDVVDCLDTEYPRTETTCRCVINYPKTINLVGYENVWVRKGYNFPCSVDGRTSEVAVTNGQITQTFRNCHKPREYLGFFHSCLNKNYPRNETTCYCTFNFPQTVRLKCIYNNNYYYWSIENYQQQCKDSPAQCFKPEELLNLYHSCENKLYPSDKTSCYCTHNYPEKIKFTCYNDYKLGKVWSIDVPSATCKYNFNPLLAHCYNDSGEIVCRCRKNCFTLDVKGNLGFVEIRTICTINSTLHYLPQFGLLEQFNSLTKSLKTICTDGYQLNGLSECTCSYGILNGSQPKCIKNTVAVAVDATPLEFETILTVSLGLNIIFLLILLPILIVYIIHFIITLNIKPTQPHEEINLNEVATSEL